MSKDSFRRQVVLNGGVGGVVVNNNLNAAINQWKKSLKESGKMEKLHENRFFRKKSEVRRKEIDAAVYRREMGFDIE